MGAQERWSSGDDGFTLMELAIVVIIIGILATIAIAVFLSQREKAERSSAVSSVRNTMTLAEAIRFEGSEFPDDPSAYTDEGGAGFTFVKTESTGPTVVSIATFESADTLSADGDGPILVVAAAGGERCYWVRRATGEDPVRGYFSTADDPCAASGTDDDGTSLSTASGGGW